MITKAIIPVAGWGTRRLPITKVLEKSMLPVGNRPLVDYSVQELIAAGVTDIYMVISDAEPCQVKKFYEENTALTKYLTERGKSDALELARTLPDGVTIHYAVQDPSAKYGTAVPIALVVEKYQIAEPVLVFMGDDFIWNPGGETAAEALLSAGQSPLTPVSPSADASPADAEPAVTSAILGVEIAPADVASYGVLSVDDGRLTSIVEKPDPADAPSNLINVSKYLMTPDLLQDICAYVRDHDFAPGEREYMVTDPIASYIARGGTIKVAPTTGEFLDGGTLSGWLHANEVVCKAQNYPTGKH